MTVISQVNKERLQADGVKVAFDFPFKVFAEGDIVVYTVVRATGVTTLQTITTHYTVALNTVTEGGTITFLSAPLNTEDVLMVRDIALTQPTDIPAVGQITEEQLETEFDRSRMIDQQLEERLDRTIQVNIGDEGVSTDIPPLVDGGVLTSVGGALTWTLLAGTGDMVLSGVQTVTGAKTFNTGTFLVKGSGGGVQDLVAASGAAGETMTLPATATTLIGKDTTDTLTNKTIDANGTGNSISNIEAVDMAATGTPDSSTFLRGDDTWAVPALTAGYGAMYIKDGLAAQVTTGASFEKMTGWAIDGASLNVTVDSTTNNRMTVLNTGTYAVFAFISLASSTALINFLYNIHVNQVASNFQGFTLSTDATPEVTTTCAMGGVLPLTAGDQLEVFFQTSAGAGQSITPSNAQFTVIRLS